MKSQERKARRQISRRAKEEEIMLGLGLMIIGIGCIICGAKMFRG